MEKQHLKRLGYGFSALVMALSAVNFVPTNAVYAVDNNINEVATLSENGVRFDLEVYMKVGEHVDVDDIVEYPEEDGWTVVIKNRSGNSVTRANTQSTTFDASATTTGKTTYDIEVSHTDGRKSSATVAFWVYRDVEYPEKILKVGDSEAVVWNYNNLYRAADGSRTSFEGDLKAGASNNLTLVDTNKAGVKYVTVTETFGNKTIKTTVPFLVAGINVPVTYIESFTDEIAKFKVEVYGEDIAETFKADPNSDNIKIERKVATDYGYWYEISVAEHGDYALYYSAQYEDGTPTGNTQYVRAYDRMALDSEEVTIDLNSDVDSADVVATGDGTIVATSQSDLGHNLFNVSLGEDGETYTIARNSAYLTETGDYTVTFTQTAGSLTEVKTVTVHVIDSSVEPEEPGEDQDPENPGEDDPTQTPDTPGEDDPTQTPDQGGLGAGGALGNGAGAGEVSAPDTGRYTAAASATSASLSVVAAVMAAITAAGAALFAKRK